MNIVDTLKQNGYRVTKPRLAILEAIGHTPQTAQEIFSKLHKKNISIDLVSIYRTLEVFAEMGVVLKVEVGKGSAHYELSDPQNHHHHLVCDECGAIEDIVLKDGKLMQEAKSKSAFRITRHTLEFFGLCARCQ